MILEQERASNYMSLSNIKLSNSSLDNDILIQCPHNQNILAYTLGNYWVILKKLKKIEIEKVM